MDRKLLLALVLSIGIMVLWNTVLFPPPKPPATPPPATTQETAAPEAAAPGETAPVPAPPEPVAPPAEPVVTEPVEADQAEEKTIETDVYKIRLTNRGAAILGWQLRNYVDDDGGPLELVGPGSAKTGRYPLGIVFPDARTTDQVARALFRMETTTVPDGRGTRVSFHYADGAGLSVEKILDFGENSYVTRAQIRVRRNGEPAEGQVIWGAGLGSDPGLAKRGGTPSDITRAVIHRDGKIVLHPKEALKGKPELAEPGAISWAGLEDHYFAALIIPEGGVGGTVLRVHQRIEEGRERNFLSLALPLVRDGEYNVYVGPKDYSVVSGLNLGIEGIVDFGFFGAIARGLFFLLAYINKYTGTWGWSIVLLTCLIRIAFFPLTHKSQVSSRHAQEKMKKIKPKMDAIKERYRKMKRDMASRQKMNEEIMALYSKEGVNPMAGMSGCLPLLLQLPILWGFYNLLNVAIELRHAPFALWITDLSKKDPYYVTPIVMGLTMLIQQLMTGSSIPDATQRRMMYLMPIIFTWFFKDLPSGLVLYWLVNNVLAIGQQYLINEQVARETTQQKAPAKG